MTRISKDMGSLFCHYLGLLRLILMITGLLPEAAKLRNAEILKKKSWLFRLLGLQYFG